MADNETVRDILVRMADDAEEVTAKLEAIDNLTDLPPTTLVEAVGLSSLVVRAAGMTMVTCADAVAQQMSAVANATDG